jgi:hypothetical protein
MAADMFNAIGALRLKRHHLVSGPDGVEIHQPGKPVLLLTHQAAHDFAQQIEEALS